MGRRHLKSDTVSSKTYLISNLVVELGKFKGIQIALYVHASPKKADLSSTSYCISRALFTN